MAHASRSCYIKSTFLIQNIEFLKTFPSLDLYRRIHYIKEFSTIVSVFRNLTFLKRIFAMLCQL